MARYAYHQVDTNQREIIAALEAGGCTVSKIGRPVDLAVGKNGRTYLFEVKQVKGKLRQSQSAFILGWRGHVGILRTVDDVQAFLRGT